VGEPGGGLLPTDREAFLFVLKVSEMLSFQTMHTWLFLGCMVLREMV